jgi:hypothetical protein
MFKKNRLFNILMQLKHGIQNLVQLKKFNNLLERINVVKFNASTATVEFSQLHTKKRKLGVKPSIMVLGHRAWENYGLWPSMKRLSIFHFYELDFVDGRWNKDLAKKTAKEILTVIDSIESTENPIELVFIYADSSFLDPELLKEFQRRGIWSVLMGLDDKHRLEPHWVGDIYSGQSLVAPLVDLYWTTWKASIPYLASLGVNPIYLPEGADPAFHRPQKLLRDIDVLFLGSCYGGRLEMVRYLRNQGFNVSAYGKGWENGFVSFETSIDLISRSKVVLGIGDVGHMSAVQHLKGRDFEVPMCGAVYLTSYNPELADWYYIGQEILCYSSPQNCAEILGIVLQDENLQESIRKAALSKSRNDHTWETRIISILKLLNGNNENAA